jgi:hypothetical protein
MHKTPILISIMFLFFIKNSIAQQLNVIGKIVDKITEHPIEGADIIIYNKADIIYKTSSDNAGNFKVPFKNFKDAQSLKIHALNYSEFQINALPPTDSVLKRGYYLGIYKMSQQIIELKEVKVQSKKRYNDTTKIDLSKKNFERSIMIDDLFSEEYGFTKDQNGRIYYKGKPIANIKVNGEDFFGENNTDIYHLLPALVLQGINVIETNVDSTTNTTSLRPTLKLNLILKDKYKKGKFGNINIGAGSAKRDLISTNLFTYRNKEQISLSLNSNNINSNDNTILEPKVDFSINGNNATNNNAGITYRNVFANKVEVNLTARGKFENKNVTSESEVQEETLKLFSRNFTSSNTRSFSLNDTRINIDYKVDTLNKISAIQTFDHSHIKGTDSLNYNIKADSLNATSQLNKLRRTNTDLLNTKITWQKKFSKKRGRMLNIGVGCNNKTYNINEFDNIYNTSDQGISKYFLDGNRSANENNYSINSNFTEPIDEEAYVEFFINYERDKISYNTQINSDTTTNNSDVHGLIISRYFKPGANFQKTFDKISFDANITAIFDERNTQQLKYYHDESFFNLNFDLKTDYKITKKHDFTFEILSAATYPEIEQLTRISNTFDVISQSSGNIQLKPEEKKGIKITYNSKPADEDNIFLMGEFDRYSNKFGLAISSSPDNLVEDIVTKNIGNSIGGQVSFSLTKKIGDGRYINYSNGISYLENPTIFNEKLTLNNGVTFHQSFSTSLSIIKSLLSVSPVLASSISKYFYETNSINVVTLSYSDRLSLQTKAFQLELYPLFTYNHSINNNESFSMNGALKRGIFKGYGTIWLQAYDIFNSFKYINNYLGPSGYQSIKYSNLTRFILLGLSLKFNNMK